MARRPPATNDEASSKLIASLIAEMDSTRTISELKSTFIWSQVRILSESLELPEDWRNYAVGTEEGDLGEKVIEDVLHKGAFPVLPVPHFLSVQDCWTTVEVEG